MRARLFIRQKGNPTPNQRKAGRHMPQRHYYESNTDYLVNFFVRTLLLILEAPDSLLDDIEKAIELSQEQREEIRKRVNKVTKGK